jgi:threonine dehydrogenase-like Zn-dependent dehydrogenase
MFAIGVIQGKEGTHPLEIPEPQISMPDDVLVKIQRVGLDGTDYGLIHTNTHDVPEGRTEMAMGHEMVGMVEEIGDGVTSLVPGDRVTLTVRRGCGLCELCGHNQSDMCMTGLYKERGIHRLDGFLTHYVVDCEQYVVKVPAEIADLAVFTEPLSIAEKAID